jgi:sigma-E factor negative regulatory protein RseC
VLETRATIIRLEGQYAVVQANRPNGCDLCQGKGCGASKLSQLFCNSPAQLKVNNSISAGIGDEVIISVAEGAVLRGVGMAYIVPLVLLVVGTMLGSMGGESSGQHDGYAALGAVLGLIGGVVIAKWSPLSHQKDRFQPFITRRWVEE